MNNIHIVKSWLLSNENLKKIAFLYIFYKGFKSLIFCFRQLYKHQLLNGNYKQILQQRYNDNQGLKNQSSSWVLVTGGASGIGAMYSEYFARLGFNIYIISVNEQQNLETQQKLNKLYQNIQVKTMKCDFGEEGFIDQINQIENLNFKILANNAGVPQFFTNLERSFLIPEENGFYENFTQREIQQNFQINSIASTQMIKWFLTRIKSLDQSKNYAIINMSSSSSKAPFFQLGVYGCGKEYFRKLSKYLDQELSDNKKLHILTVTPGLVSTPMTLHRIDPTTITPEQCVQGVLKCLANKQKRTYSSQKHEIQYKIVQQIGKFSMKLQNQLAQLELEKFKSLIKIQPQNNNSQDK